MKKKAAPDEALRLVKEELDDARAAIVQFQHLVERSALRLDRAQIALRVCAEVHLLRSDTACALLACNVADELNSDLEEFRKLSKLSVDDAITDLTIPF